MKRESYISLLLAITLVVGCEKNDDFDAGRQNHRLNVSVKGIVSGAWNSKSRAATTDIAADTLWLNDSIYVEAVAEDIVAEKAPTTRATPVTNAKQIETLSIVMFNTGSSRWSTASSQESGKSPILARNTNGSYIINNPYIWLEEDPNYRTLIAMSPQHTTNGFALSNSGQSLDVTVPNDVAKQYDLCVSDISLNKDILYTIGSNSNQQQFEMAHVMTAVGFEAAGYDLMLTGVKFIGVNSKNTLTFHSRTWGSSPSTPINFEAKINADQWLNSEHIQTSNPWRNITPNDGYLMMLPQSHTDGMKLEFTFTGQGGQPAGTYTMKLKDIKASGAATSEWKSGVKITYRLRLKTRPAVQLNNITISDHLAGSTTPALNIITSTDDDLTFSWTASWMGMYRGTNSTITNPESNGYFTPFQTGVNNWANVKFFARNENKSTIANRTATITVSGKKSGVRTFTVTQPKLAPSKITYFEGGVINAQGRGKGINVIVYGSATLSVDNGFGISDNRNPRSRSSVDLTTGSYTFYITRYENFGNGDKYGTIKLSSSTGTVTLTVQQHTCVVNHTIARNTTTYSMEHTDPGSPITVVGQNMRLMGTANWGYDGNISYGRLIVTYDKVEHRVGVIFLDRIPYCTIHCPLNEKPIGTLHAK